MSWKHRIAASALLAAASAAGVSQPAPASAPAAPEAAEVLTPQQLAFRRASPSIFIHARATAFRSMARQHLCRGSQFSGEFQALSRRIDAAGRTLRARYGDYFNRPDEVLARTGCNDGRLHMTMSGYRNAVAELELFVSRDPVR